MTPSERDPVQFTRESAERIANVVRAAELSPSQGRPLSFDAQQPSARAKVFRLATFTAQWNKGASQVVTFLNQTTTPNTAVVFNSLYNIAIGSTAPLTAAIARDGTAWRFVNSERGCANAHHREFLSTQSSPPDGEEFDTLIALPGDDCVKWTKVKKKRVVSDISIVAGSQPALLVTYLDAWIPSQPSSPESESKLFPVADCES